MIDASELRIGNLVLVDGGNIMPFHHEIMAKDILDIESGASKEKGISIEGIQLSKIWLEKSNCRFPGDLYGGYLIDLNTEGSAIRITRDKGGYYWFSGCNHVRVDYVHQLQNLYRSLTGTELTFNQQ